PDRPIPTLFPYTTLFRSIKAIIAIIGAKNRTSDQGNFLIQPSSPFAPLRRPVRSNTANIAKAVIKDGKAMDKLMNTCMNFNPSRSEEHTSELQSRFDLVC